MVTHEAVKRIEYIRQLFQQTQEVCANGSPKQWIQQADPLFISICYEAWSMHIALADIAARGDFAEWKTWSAEHTAHDVQIHVGLGWALAQHELWLEEFVMQLPPLLRYRVADGYGYYEGVFRKRKSVLSQLRPQWTDGIALGAYNQGLGRSLWYGCLANADAVVTAVEKFNESRRADLWRGVGIAVAYVGGCNTDVVHHLKDLSGDYVSAFSAGALMALKSRQDSGAFANDTLSVCTEIWRLDEERLRATYMHTLEQANKSHNAYEQWIKFLEGSYAAR